MEALSPELLPSNSAPPLNIILSSNQNILPPIRNLPTWNRTTLGYKKTHQVVKKNQVNKITSPDCPDYQIEQWTQTSPTGFQKQPPHTPIKSTKPPTEKEALENLYNKKIVFLQSIHGEILQNLQEEIEQLKNENKALQFSLVMANGNLKHLQSEHKSRETDMNMNTESSEISSLTSALLETKNELLRVQEENQQLRELLENVDLEGRNISPENISNMNYTTSSQLISERNLKLLKFVPQSKMASELNVGQSKSEEYMNGFLRKNTEFKVHRRNKSHTSSEAQTFKTRNLVLPRLNISHNRKKSTSQNKHLLTRDQMGPVTLPVLQSMPVSNSMPVRQKRAPTQSLHAKQKRSNKGISLPLSTSK